MNEGDSCLFTGHKIPSEMNTTKACIYFFQYFKFTQIKFQNIWQGTSLFGK